VGKESATSGVQVTNSTTGAVIFATPAIVPEAKPAEFFVASAPSGSVNCVPGYRLEPGTSCSFGVRFAPLAAGTRTEKWYVKFLSDVPAREVNLEGTAIASAASVTSSSPTSGSSAANSPPAGSAPSIDGTLGLSALAVAGGAGRQRPDWRLTPAATNAQPNAPDTQGPALLSLGLNSSARDGVPMVGPP
jgi:hypothetical protein